MRFPLRRRRRWRWRRLHAAVAAHLIGVGCLRLAQGAGGRGGGFERPLTNYEDVIAPSGARFVSRQGSTWTRSFLFANLLGEHLRRLVFDGELVSDEEGILEAEHGRLARWSTTRRARSTR
jgi:hypothetical protein